MSGKHTTPDPIDVAVGARMRFRRRSLGMTQNELAQGLGVTFQQCQKYERGSNRVSASMLVKVARRLETSAAALLGEDGTGQPLAQLSELVTPGATELLAAFAKIRDTEVRRALVNLAQAVCVDQPLPVAVRTNHRDLVPNDTLVTSHASL